MIGALTWSHHYSSLKLLFVPPRKKWLGLNQLVAKHFGPWLRRSWKCCMFVLSFGNFSEVSRSQINKRLLWSGLQSDWGRWDAPCPLWNPALPSCQPQLDVWLAARSEWIFFFLGKEQIKHLVGLRSQGSLSSIKEHLELVSPEVVKHFQTALGTFLLTFVVQREMRGGKKGIL